MTFSFKKLLLITLCVSCGAGLFAQTPTVIDPISRKIFDVPEIPISVSCENPEILATARRAFEIHGGFKVATEQNAKYKLSLTPSSTGVAANLVGGSAPFSQITSGADQRQATLRACDAVVSHILNIPGFFDSKLAFVSDATGNREIYASDLMFSNVRRLTNDRSNSLYPRWSPDGTRLLYTGYFNTGFPDVFMLDLANNRRTTVASYKGTNTGATFSPDGTRIAMALSSSGNPEIYIGDAAGKNLKRLTNTKSLESTPVFSPDGTRLIYVNDQTGGPQLYEMAIDGTGVRRISRGLSNHCTEPSWNPRKPNLVVFTAAFGRGFQLALLDRASGKAEALTAGPGSGMEAFWLNDGRHVVYTQRQGTASKLRIFDTESGRGYDLHAPRLGNTSQAAALYTGNR